jgi:beta-glucanase (GH16 family)
MKNLLKSPLLLALVLIAFPLSRLCAASAKPLWSDEFDQAIGSPPDTSRWVYDLGATGWGNNELQTYTEATENAAIAADPQATDGKALVIKALKRPQGGYTSARLKTQGKFSTLYGRIEGRLKTTNGQGIWPAFWMLGENIETVGWPSSGEIDILEVVGANPNKVHGTLHGPGYSGAKGPTATITLPTGTLDKDYHVYAIDWAPNKIVWSFDGRVYHAQTPKTLPPGAKWVFNDAPFFLLLNLAVGGNWPGNPDDTTPFPQIFSIDYIRVYRTAIESVDTP